MTIWPQITMIAMYAAGYSIHLMRHGETRADKYTAYGTAFAIIVEATVLYFGGFWTPIMGSAQ